MKILIVNSNPIHEKLEQFISSSYDAEIINEKDRFTVDFVNEYNPDFIFFPHWSYFIPSEIYDNYNCVVFHMTDLPYGRGGSPLQNLIVKGHQETKLSALKVVKELDAGDIYLKEPLSLLGTADEIFLRVSKLIISMIIRIVENNISPYPQEGEIVKFKRRKKEDGDVSSLESLENFYDYIRMLDSDHYPSAFLETENFRLEFSRASLKKDRIIADVRIFQK